MSTPKLPVPSFFLGVLVAALVFFSLAQKTPDATTWKYRILIDASEKQIAEATAEGWEYVGYLGQSTLGEGTDESLWRRPE